MLQWLPPVLQWPPGADHPKWMEILFWSSITNLPLNTPTNFSGTSLIKSITKPRTRAITFAFSQLEFSIIALSHSQIDDSPSVNQLVCRLSFHCPSRFHLSRLRVTGAIVVSLLAPFEKRGPKKLQVVSINSDACDWSGLALVK